MTPNARLTFSCRQGSAITGSIHDIATLRLSIFQEFPYLYSGTIQNELGYLQHYAAVRDAIAVTVSDTGNVAGAATGIPLTHEGQQLTAPFATAHYQLEQLYYVGELLLYPRYRNHGLGHHLLNLVEEQVRAFEQYRSLVCATVVRPDDHPLRPADFLPIDRFLARTGFSMLAGLNTAIHWRELDGIERAHPMQFWIKELS